MIGRKLNMTQTFLPDGTRVAVTRIQLEPNVVTQIKRFGAQQSAMQIGSRPAKRLNKPDAGHLKDLPPMRVLKEFRSSQDAKRGDVISLDTFSVGEKVDAIGTSKGRGFAGVVKRHGFAGGPASHGHKDNLRAPGSIGAGGVQRVFKGMRMGGHMGFERVTIKNLEVVSVDAERNEILLKGAVPGARNSVVVITSGNGDLKFAE